MTHSLLLPEETATAAALGLCPLRCPDCGATPTFAPTPTQALPGGWFGVLRCDCHADPVLDSIPILRRGAPSPRPRACCAGGWCSACRRATPVRPACRVRSARWPGVSCAVPFGDCAIGGVPIGCSDRQER
jgi:hypothetical protein